MTTSAQGQRGLLSSLFDFGFTTFITLTFLRVIYAVVMVVIGLMGLVLFITLASYGGLAVLGALVVVPIVTLLYLVLARVGMETVALFFRMGEDLSALRRATAPPASGPDLGFGWPAGGPGGFGGGGSLAYGGAPQG